MDFQVNKEEMERRKKMAGVLIPENKSLFFVNNMWFTNENSNPKGKQYSNDFTIRINIQWIHAETEKLINKLNNNFDYGLLQRSIYLYSVGDIYNLDVYDAMMKQLGLKSDDGRYHIIENGKKVFKGHENSGPLGMPAILNIVHRIEPVLKAREGAEKNQYGSYDKSDLVQAVDPDTKEELVRTVEYIDITQPENDSWKAKMRSGFPILGTLTEEQAKLRSEYFVYGEDSDSEESNYGENAEGETVSNKVSF